MVKVSFAVFYLVYAETLNWEVPDFHLDVCDFLEDYGELGLLMMPRGHGKSTILDIYNAWRLYLDPDHLILHQGATDPDAYKVSRGTEQVLERHPLCKLFGVEKARGETQKWWVSGSTDVRHGSIHARGILSNVTGARAKEIQNDDVEVPSNIGTPEAREKLRYRLSEQIHILIPGGQKLFVGTPHTHESLYTDIKQNPDCKSLIYKMFQNEKRFEGVKSCVVDFLPKNIFSGIYKTARLLKEADDYIIEKRGNAYVITFREVHSLLDVYGEALWPERFTPKVMQSRRRECRTINEWDSQYQLHAKPIADVRLDPDKLVAYDCEPIIRVANGETIMLLGNEQIASATFRWDPSGGKTKSDASSGALVLQDKKGRYYWHRAERYHGPVSTTDNSGKINGGQVWKICDLIEKFQLSRVDIETNGIGGFAPAALRGALKARGLRCGIAEIHSSKAKNKRILEAVEAPLISGELWAHLSVLTDNGKPDGEDSEQVKQMRLFNPAITEQPDDDLDSLAGAISAEPVRIGKSLNKVNYKESQDWRMNGGTHEAALDFDN